jgi:hypothetical protein
MKKPARKPAAPKPQPPYDAVRLLMQMEEAARERILAAFDLKSSFVHCVVTLERGKLESIAGKKYRQSTLRADYNINDHRMSTSVIFYNDGGTVPLHVREDLKQKIAEEIVFVMLSGVWDQILAFRVPK